MRVLHVVSSLDPRAGGPVVALSGLVKAQIKAGLQVHVLASFEEPFDDTTAQYLRSLGAEVKLVGPVSGPLKSHKDLLPAVRKLVAQADVVHIHAVWEEIQHQAAVAARRSKKPYVFRTCGMLDPWQLDQGRFKKALYLKLRLKTDLDGATSLHFTSQEEHRLVEPLYLKSPGIVEANGVEIPQADRSGSPTRFRERFGIGSEVRILLFLSRIHPKKGLDLLIPAFAKAGIPETKLVIAGPDENGYQQQVEALIAQYDLQERILFTGILQGDDKLDAFAAAELFVLPSYQENFGNAVVEALAVGTPVLISDQVNIHPEIRAAEVGGVVPTEIEALTKALQLWMSDTELRQSAAHRAQAFAMENYDWNAIAQRWAQRYRSYL